MDGVPKRFKNLRKKIFSAKRNESPVVPACPVLYISRFRSPSLHLTNLLHFFLFLYYSITQCSFYINRPFFGTNEISTESHCHYTYIPLAMDYSALRLGPVAIILLLDCIIIGAVFDSHDGRCFYFFF